MIVTSLCGMHTVLCLFLSLQTPAERHGKSGIVCSADDHVVVILASVRISSLSAYSLYYGALTSCVRKMTKLQKC